MNTDLFDTFFEKHSNIKFHENPSSGSYTEGQTDMTNLIVTFVFVRMCVKEQSVNKGFPVSTQRSKRPILKAQQLSSPIRKVLTYFEWWPCCLTLYAKVS